MTTQTHRLTRTVLAALLSGGLAQAQATKLKWAHVYETSEPYHKWSVWAADEFKKRTNGKYEIQVFPASSLGKESDINQGLQLGTVDIILTGASFALAARASIRAWYLASSAGYACSIDTGFSPFITCDTSRASWPGRKLLLPLTGAPQPQPQNRLHRR